MPLPGMQSESSAGASGGGFSCVDLAGMLGFHDRMDRRAKHPRRGHFNAEETDDGQPSHGTPGA